MGDLTQIDTVLPNPAATERLAAAIARKARIGDAILLSGDLGAGKTHFARAFINTLSPEPEEVPSPTFTLVQTYAANTATGPAEIWHFDLYRLKSPEEAYDLAIEDAFAEGISLVEWPDRLGGLRPREHLEIRLEIAPDGTARQASLHPTPQWRDRLAAALADVAHDDAHETAGARDAVIARFLVANGWGEAVCRPMVGDGSVRRYSRLLLQGKRRVLMDCPPALALDPYLEVDAMLRRIGLSAPEIHAADRDSGLALLEDFGDDTFTHLMEQGADERVLYELAVDVLIALHRRATPEALKALPAFDDDRALDGLNRMLDWYWPAIRGAAASYAVRSEFESAWRAVLPIMRQVPESIALFDYHTDNLIRLDRPGIAGCGLLDFQDAVKASVVFDLATLLENDRRAIPAPLRESLVERYLAAFPALDRDAFMRAFAVKTAHWNTRIVGTFARLLRRDGKPGYQRFMPRVWDLIERHVADPTLAPVAEWYRRYLPPADRCSLGPDGSPMRSGA